MFQIKVSIICIALLLIAGCAKPPEQALSPSESQKKLIRLCEDEYNLNIVTKAYENTLWIYVPLDRPFLSLGSSKEGPSKSSQPDEKLIIKYIDGDFNSNAFHLTYDIELTKSYTENKGITTKASEEYMALQQFLLSAINRAYGDIEKNSKPLQRADSVTDENEFTDSWELSPKNIIDPSHVKNDEAPDFFVIIIADIINGIEMQMLLHIQDLRRALVDQGFGEEYIKRLIVDQPIGHDVIVDDKKGEHLDTRNITWAEFLIKQIVYRVTLKYTFSAFPPSNDTRQELLTIAADTMAAYNFTDFTSINLQDLNTGASFSFSPEDLASHATEPSKGRLINIKFQ